MNEISPPPLLIGRHERDNSNFDRDKRGTFRALVEAFVSLFIAVLLFRTFAAEGYMISTGSMAPSLLGYHKRVVCPTCGITFPFGTAYDSDDDLDAAAVLTSRTRAVCPNCGQPGIDVSDVPRNHGDQLLVNKQAYLYASPKRWEVVVFRNPARPTEAYVKRIAGLPGERIQIVGGDIVINGQIARKSFGQQLDTRILVHCHQYLPANDSDFQPHWMSIPLDGPNSRSTASRSWAAGKASFIIRGGDVRRPDMEPVAWVEYRHWIRSGGQHDTEVALERWPEDIDSRIVPKTGLRFDPKNREVGITGALPLDTARQLMEMTEDVPFRNAIVDLYEASHVAMVSDSYGYNPDEETGTPNPVLDLMFSSRISSFNGSGEFRIEMTNGTWIVTVVLDAARREAQLYAETEPQQNDVNSRSTKIGSASALIESTSLPLSVGSKGVTIECSLFDQQVIVAIDGKPLFSPWNFEMPEGAQPPRIPVRFGARGLDMTVSRINLYRDVYYTDTRGRHAVNRPYELKANEFFVLGDNSPVSHDSRRWDNPVVNRSLLIGKPFLVHLPSKPGILRMGSREIRLRLPDWQRIRFLR